jgi:hypothetical protein
MICGDCGTNMTVQKTTKRSGEYRYLRCRACPSGGYGAPNPDEIYSKLVDEVLAALGHEPVQVREYAPGAAARQEMKELKDSIAYYMKELAPGGRFTKTRFTQERAGETLDDLIDQLATIDLETTKDRWVNVPNGNTFRSRWEECGVEALAADLLRGGVKCEIKRTKVKGVRAPEVDMRLVIPTDVRERLIIKQDPFAEAG